MRGGSFDKEELMNDEGTVVCAIQGRWSGKGKISGEKSLLS